MKQDMAGKVALVTGGGSGIGRATALALAERGVKVVIADIDAKGGEATLGMIEDSGGQGIFIKTDVTQAKDVAAMVGETVRVYGRLDYAHNNAGSEGVSVPITEYPEDVWDRTVSINLKGVWLCLKYEIPVMRQQGQGAIVNTSSMAGLGAVPNASAYIATKHGVVGLTKAAAVENPGIRVNAVCPGPVDTPMMERLLSQSGEAYGVLGTPESIAEAVLWLFSDASSAVNGHALVMGANI